jgi:hypothetical protein
MILFRMFCFGVCFSIQLPICSFSSFKGNYRVKETMLNVVDINKYITMHENAFVWKGTAYRSGYRKVIEPNAMSILI